MLIYVNITDRQADKHIKSKVRDLTKKRNTTTVTIVVVLVFFEKSQLLLYYYYYFLNFQSHNLHDDFIVVN